MTEILTLRIDTALKQQLVERARDDDRTLSNYVRRCLVQAVATDATAEDSHE